MNTTAHYRNHRLAWLKTCKHSISMGALFSVPIPAFNICAQGVTGNNRNIYEYKLSVSLRVYKAAIFIFILRIN